jgi:phosphoribosyl-ATP pyrophosphohydrolase
VAVLDELWRTIRKRNAERPEGSYTTHLFTEGEEKIRKKTGEEAVELLLARREEELVHESADLVYHLLVLLESTGIGIAPLLAELRRRAGG